MADITDDQKEFTVALEGEGDTTPGWIRVRDDALIDEIRSLRSAVESMLKMLTHWKG